ncbi:MAG: NHL repeat-containing protein [Desulfovibrionaceae bacterium]
MLHCVAKIEFFRSLFSERWRTGFILSVLLWLAVAPAMAARASEETAAPSEPGTLEDSSAPAAPLPLISDSPLFKVGTMHCIVDDYDGVSLSKPTRVAIDSVRSEIYVTDSGHARILVYTYDFYPLLAIGASEGMETPMGVAVDKDGYVFVAQARGVDKRGARITVLTPALTWSRDIHVAGFEGSEGFQPRNITLDDNGGIYVAGDFPGVVVLDRKAGFIRLLQPIDTLGKEQPHPVMMNDVAVDGKGRVFLLSEEMGRVYVYDAQGEFLFKFGEKGGGPGKLSRPRGIAVDRRSGRVYVTDYMRHAVNIYAADGGYLSEFGGKGWLLGWFQFPSDVGVDASGNVLVADTFNNRVQVLQVK